jgi:hypothetical protein
MSGSAKAGTIAERHTCELRVLPESVVRAPPKRASGEIFFSLTKTYMDVGNSGAILTLLKRLGAKPPTPVKQLDPEEAKSSR